MDEYINTDLDCFLSVNYREDNFSYLVDDNDAGEDDKKSQPVFPKNRKELQSKNSISTTGKQLDQLAKDFIAIQVMSAPAESLVAIVGNAIKKPRNNSSPATTPIGEFVIETFSDASFALGPDAKSISGMAVYVNRNLVKWLSKKQYNITRSTAAAESVALSIAEDHTVHLKDFITSLGYKVNATKLYEDNQAVIACCQKKSISHTRKMVDIKMKIIRERLIEKFYTFEYVPSMLTVADMFTKALSVGTYRRSVAQLFMQPEAGAKE